MRTKDEWEQLEYTHKLIAYSDLEDSANADRIFKRSNSTTQDICIKQMFMPPDKSLELVYDEEKQPLQEQLEATLTSQQEATQILVPETYVTNAPIIQKLNST